MGSNRKGYPYHEPSELREIRDQSIGIKHSLDRKPSRSDLEDRIHSAWLGRCLGCLLGKPVEGWPRKEIETYLKKTDSYPLENFFVYQPELVEDEPIQFHPSASNSTRGNIQYFPRDDDLDYTILNLDVLHQNGIGFH